MRQRREIRTCEAAMKSLSTAAELVSWSLWKQQPQMAMTTAWQQAASTNRRPVKKTRDELLYVHRVRKKRCHFIFCH